MCKPLPPPLVRGGVFEVGLETKYRDIADGNNKERALVQERLLLALETKYRDIADGNGTTQAMPKLSSVMLETKYRDIADGNRC